jgi:hypothetical protein
MASTASTELVPRPIDSSRSQTISDYVLQNYIVPVCMMSDEGKKILYQAILCGMIVVTGGTVFKFSKASYKSYEFSIQFTQAQKDVNKALKEVEKTTLKLFEATRDIPNIPPKIVGFLNKAINLIKQGQRIKANQLFLVIVDNIKRVNEHQKQLETENLIPRVPGILELPDMSNLLKTPLIGVPADKLREHLEKINKDNTVAVPNPEIPGKYRVEPAIVAAESLALLVGYGNELSNDCSWWLTLCLISALILWFLFKHGKKLKLLKLSFIKSVKKSYKDKKSLKAKKSAKDKKSSKDKKSVKKSLKDKKKKSVKKASPRSPAAKSASIYYCG